MTTRQEKAIVLYVHLSTAYNSLAQLDPELQLLWPPIVINDAISVLHDLLRFVEDTAHTKDTP